MSGTNGRCVRTELFSALARDACVKKRNRVTSAHVDTVRAFMVRSTLSSCSVSIQIVAVCAQLVETKRSEQLEEEKGQG